MKQLKHRYCRCRTLAVTFVYYEFGTLSCATKLTKVPHFCTNCCRDWNCSQKNAIKQQDQTLWYCCAAPCRKETDDQLWPTATIFLTCRKEPRKTTLNHLEKNYNSNKIHMGAARLRPTWCLWSTLSTLQAWKKVPSFCEPGHCLFVVVVWVMYKQCPAAQWSDPRRCSCPCAPPGLCVAPRTHVTEGRLENPLLPAINTKGDGSIWAYHMFSPGLGSWPLQPGSQLRPAGDQTFQKCH